MAPLITRIASALGRPRSPRVGDCMVCAHPVRERDDRMRVHGRYVHTRCAGYTLRGRARGSRRRGAQDADHAFTGD